MIAFCDGCFYLDSPSKQLRIDYSKCLLLYCVSRSIRCVMNIGTLDVKSVANVVIALKKPIEMGKRRLDCICLPLDNHTDRKMLFEDKKRQVNGKAYSIFLTILKLKFPFTVILLPRGHV